MTTTLSSGTTASARYSKRSIALAAVIAAALTSLVNLGIASLSLGLGTAVVPQLNPVAYISASAFASIVGAIGWAIIARRARNPRLVLAILAAGILLLSLIGLTVLAATTVATTGWAPIVTLAIMHLTTISIAVGTYSLLLPVQRA